MNILQWNFNQNTNLFIHENKPDHIVFETAAILFRGRWVKNKNNHYRISDPGKIIFNSYHTLFYFPVASLPDTEAYSYQSRIGFVEWCFVLRTSGQTFFHWYILKEEIPRTLRKQDTISQTCAFQNDYRIDIRRSLNAFAVCRRIHSFKYMFLLSLTKDGNYYLDNS